MTWAILLTAALLIFTLAVAAFTAPTLHHDDPDGLSDDEREALRIIRERGE